MRSASGFGGISVNWWSGCLLRPGCELGGAGAGLVTPGQGGRQGRSCADAEAGQEACGVISRGGRVEARLGRLKAGVVFISVSHVVLPPAELLPRVQGTPSPAAGHLDALGEAQASPKGAPGRVPCPVGKQVPWPAGQAPVPGGTGRAASILVWSLWPAARARPWRGGVTLGRETRAKDS